MFRSLVRALWEIAHELKELRFTLSAIKDAADAMVAATNDLITAANALIAAFEAGNPADIQAAVDELKTATTTATDETANINTVLHPPTP